MGKLRRYCVTYPILFTIIYLFLTALFLIKPVRHKIFFDMRPDAIKMLHEVIKSVSHYILAGIFVFWIIMYVIYLIIKWFVPWPFKKPLMRAPVLKECNEAGVFQLLDSIKRVVFSFDSPYDRFMNVLKAFHHFLRRNLIDILNLMGMNISDIDNDYVDTSALGDVDIDNNALDKKQRKRQDKQYKKYVKKTGADERGHHMDKYMQCVEENVNVNWNPVDNITALTSCRAMIMEDIMGTITD